MISPRRHRGNLAVEIIITTVLLCAVVVSGAPDGSKLVEMYKNALSLHQHGETKAALTLYERILGDESMRSQLSPKSAATLYNNAGGLYYQRGDADAAHERFAAAVNLVPDHAEALVNLALVLSEDKKQHEVGIGACSLRLS